jgi:hypothetical protein
MGGLTPDTLVRLRQGVAFRHIDHLRVRRHELVGTEAESVGCL